MDKDVRSAIQRSTQNARVLLERELGEQLEGVYDIRLDGTIPAEPGRHLNEAQTLTREKLIAAIDHYAALRRTPPESVAEYLREAAFTTLNRFVALKMLEARKLVQECVSRGDQSSGFREFCGLAAGLTQLPDQGYRLYLESLFDEIGQEVGILFDRRDPSGLLWPRRQALNGLLAILNAPELADAWADDETIGWVYQYFNSADERKKMRDESQAPRNSRELAVRNQFFTPRYVVQFLVDNTLGRTWWQMRGGVTRLADTCEFLVVDNAGELVRAKKDPRDLRILDPAVGSGHFLLYAFDLLEIIYDEAWHDDSQPTSTQTSSTLKDDYPELGDLHRALPALILRHNLFGVEIDSRAAQIAALALWLRAQRAYRGFAIPPAERELVIRTHIVVAEPMPGDTTLVEAFAAELNPPLLRDLFIRMVAEMQSAGELGTLLRVDDAIATTLTEARERYVQQAMVAGHLPGLEPERRLDELDLSQIDDEQFFEDAETLLLDALRRFSESASGSAGVRRWLFADDAAQGIAFIEVVRTRFDVLLMNPPFGEPTATGSDYLAHQYSNTRLDLFAAFTERLLELAEQGGVVGAITPRDGFFKKTLGGWRELILDHHLHVVADLGIGVLDATVRVAAYVIERDSSAALTRFIDLVDVTDKESDLATSVRTSHRTHDVRMPAFRALPLSRFLYWLPDRLWELFESGAALENIACTPRYGLTTLDDERFVRLSHEVNPTTIGVDNVWVFLSKGGDDFPYGGVSAGLVKWKDSGLEMGEVNRRSNGQIAQTRRASKYYFLPAITFPNRSVQFSARWHPSNYVFSVRGPAVIPLEASQAYILGFFNSRLIRALVEMQTASQTYTSGVLKELRWIEPSAEVREVVERAASAAFGRVRRLLSTVETDPFFVGLYRHSDDRPNSVLAFFDWRRSEVEAANIALRSVQMTIDGQIADLYGVSLSDIERCEGSDDSDRRVSSFPPPFAFTTPDPEALGSYLFGIAVGRWTQPVEDGVPSLADPAPATPPALALPSDVSPIVVDDDGHPLDIPRLVVDALEGLFPSPIEDNVESLERALGADIRHWLRHVFFKRHVAAYTSIGRSAPIYWQLGTPSGSYSVWLYAHRVGRDSLYQVLNDLLAPKLAAEERKKTALLEEAGSNPTASQRKELAAQEAFVEELRVLRDEVARVAPLWNPDLNDGVVVAMAPLWRLVQHKPWQKELKTRWDALVAGKYDWARLAMHLWPERVVEKCQTDRSVAIAHDLEGVFWEQDEDGKWKSRTAPTRVIEELVAERTSLAVKDALAKLLAAPSLTSLGRGRPSRALSRATS